MLLSDYEEVELATTALWFKYRGSPKVCLE